ncbi:DUF664 domain-containing protein [Nocardioides plantarum]|uniref:DUF664 domain-containing protein n=1 Tax=Nocardioides plantarum TaxID=29299 RepID=A0ABV5KAR2_9ACTN|nr:DUF664 domain-containing protein [Nocardioides plantarum]
MTTAPWEPPLAGTDVEHLVGSLERLRATFRWKADGLDAAGLTTTIGSSSLTLGGLLKHLALVEDYHRVTKIGGGDLSDDADSPYRAHDGTDDWEFRTAAHDSPAELYALYDGAVERYRSDLAARIAGDGIDQLVAVADGEGHHASLRRMVFDMVEEYGRHTGHADLLREAVDGRVGEDPPADWRPSA